MKHVGTASQIAKHILCQKSSVCGHDEICLWRYLYVSAVETFVYVCVDEKYTLIVES